MIAAKDLPMNRLQVESLEARDVPAGDLVYALPVDGLAAASYTRIAADNVGNVYVAGNFTGTIDVDPSTTAKRNFTSKGGTDVFVATYGFNGQLVWARQLGGTANDAATDITFDGAGNVYICGNFNGTVDFDPGTPVVSGTAAAGGSAFVWKLGFAGAHVMTRTIGGGSTSATSLAVDPLGNIFVSGSFKAKADFDPSTATSFLETTNTNGAAYAWRLNYNGLLTYARAFQSTGLIDTTAIAADGAGNLYLGGSFTGKADFNPGTAVVNVDSGTQRSAFLVKLTFGGNYWWSQTLRNTTAASTSAIIGLGFDNIGNIYASGNLTGVVDFDPSATKTFNLTSAGLTDGFVWKTDPNGTGLFAGRFGGVNADTVTDFFVDKFGNTTTVGTFSGTADFDPGTPVANLVAGVSDTFVVKLSQTGSLLYTRSLGGGTSNTNVTGVWADGFGNIYASGGFTGTADFEPAETVSSIARATGGGYIVKLSPTVRTGAKPPNLPPVSRSAGGPYTINEGQGLTLKATATDPEANPLTYSWDVNGDGIFGDATGATVTLSASRMAQLGLADGKPPVTVRVRISDGFNLPVEASTTLTINNVNPTGTIKGATPTVKIGTTLVATVTATDISGTDVAAGLRYSFDFNNDGTWDLGNGTTFAGSVTTKAITIPATAFAVPGVQTIKVRIFDKDGGFTDATTAVNVTL
jgi:Beta-propeller repeat